MYYKMYVTVLLPKAFSPKRCHLFGSTYLGVQQNHTLPFYAAKISNYYQQTLLNGIINRRLSSNITRWLQSLSGNGRGDMANHFSPQIHGRKVTKTVAKNSLLKWHGMVFPRFWFSKFFGGPFHRTPFSSLVNRISVWPVHIM